jgi:hypothetical protein
MAWPRTIFMTLIAATLVLASCWRGDATTSRKDVSNGALPVGPECETDSLRPSTAAPAEGLWLAEESSQAMRVAVMVGPARAIEGDLRVLRRLEAIEVGVRGDTLRNEANGATVHLELLPARSVETLGAAGGDTVDARHPVATYAVGPAVIVAAYEACAAGVTSPRLRYLRFDSRRRVVTDVMLQRLSR